MSASSSGFGRAESSGPHGNGLTLAEVVPLDARRSTTTQAPPTPGTATRAVSAIERVRGVPGVTEAVLLGKDGAPTDETSAGAEDLAGRAAFLATIGDRLGAALGAGPVRSAVIHGQGRHVLLLGARNHYLALHVEGVRVGAAEAHVRKLLAPKP